jgi:hypothetical protein
MIVQHFLKCIGDFCGELLDTASRTLELIARRLSKLGWQGRREQIEPVMARTAAARIPVLARTWPTPLLATAGVAGIATLLSGAHLAERVVTWAKPVDDATSAIQSVNPQSPAFLPVFAPEPSAGPEAALPGVSTDPDVSHQSAISHTFIDIPDTPPGLDDVARTLQQRREEILQLEARLALREAAIRAAEADVMAQIERLETFQLELEALVGAAEAEEEERLQQLVKMYESMRAKSAAAIFDQLELPVILAVAKRMREARMAGILAAMNPNRARVVTTELARERELPRLD